MATIGAERLLSEHGSPDAVAEAWILGKLDSYDQRYAPEVCGKERLLAAEIRIRLRHDKIIKTPRKKRA